MKCRLGAILGLLLLASTTVVPAQTPAARATLRMISGTEPLTLNPILLTTAQDDEVFALFSDLLVVSDDRGGISPQLAARVPTLQNGDISKDGLSIAYHLRHGVKWHDGVPFTSKDVRFSWEAVMNPRNNVASRTGYDLVQRVELPDDYTAIFRLKRRYAPAVLSLFGGGSNCRLIPEHLLGKESSLNQVDFNQHPVGTGPFKVVSWKRGQSLELAANDDYFLGKPKLSRIVVQFVPSSTTAGIMLRTHETDLARLDSATYREVRDDPGIRVVLTPQFAFIALQLNVSRPALHDVRVRRALAYAIDRASIVEKDTFGTGQVADGDLGPISWAHSDEVTHYPFDPAKAKALLDEAGWKTGPDGIRQKDRKRLELEMVEATGGTTGHNEDVQVQQMLHDVGIVLTIKGYAPSLVFAPASQGGVLPSGNYDAYISGWIGGADPDNASNFTCAAISPAGQNSMRYCSRTLDAAESEALGTYDLAARKRAYAEIERILSEDLPMIFLYWPKGRFGMNRALRGFATNGVTVTWNAYAWSL